MKKSVLSTHTGGRRRLWVRDEDNYQWRIFALAAAGAVGYPAPGWPPPSGAGPDWL